MPNAAKVAPGKRKGTTDKMSTKVKNKKRKKVVA